MKFSQHLLENQFPVWKNEYMQYNQLKDFIKQRPCWTQADENYFIENLMTPELNKVHAFIHLNINQVGTDAKNLITFININDVGFYKILKKHDKWCRHVAPLFTSVRFRDLHHQFQSFVTLLKNQMTTTTTQYWIHLDNLTEVQAILLFHLPATSSGVIHTAYFDHQFTLYTELLERKQKAEMIRARWYGENDASIYFERKKHVEAHPKGSFTTITKDRFQINQQQVQHYLGNGNDPISKSIQQNQLKSTLRSSHHRTTYNTAHQDPFHISLDTNLTFTKSDDFWWRTNDKTPDCFPYAILEIKSTTDANVLLPEWLTQLVESSLYQVPYFSKYLHGTCHFYRDQLTLLPWWLSDMNIDIRKRRIPPVTKHIYHSHHTASSCTIVDESPTTNKYAPPPSACDLFLSSDIISKIKTILTDDPQQPEENHVSMMTWLYAKLTNNSTLLLPNNNKKKIEPKIFFAIERTFISWLQFSALLLSVSLGLINFGDHISKTSGGFLIVIAIFLAAYAQTRFQYRAWQLKFRESARFDDRLGPAILCFVLVVALFVNLALRIHQPLSPHSSPFGNSTSTWVIQNHKLPNGTRINKVANGKIIQFDDGRVLIFDNDSE